MHAPKSWLNLPARELQIGEGKTRAARRTVYLNDETAAILEARLALPGSWLFPSQRFLGRHITTLARKHDRACKLSKRMFVMYDLRHTWATRMAVHTDPITLASMLGHANLRTIMRYVHPQSEEKRRAQERYDAAMKRTQLKVVNR